MSLAGRSLWRAAAPGCRAAGFMSLTVPGSFTQLLTPGSQHLVRRSAGSSLQPPVCSGPVPASQLAWPTFAARPLSTPTGTYTAAPAFCLQSRSLLCRVQRCATRPARECAHLRLHTAPSRACLTARTSRLVELLLLVFASASPLRPPSKKMSGSRLCTLPVGFFSLAFNSLPGIESHPYSCFFQFCIVSPCSSL